MKMKSKQLLKKLKLKLKNYMFTTLTLPNSPNKSKKLQNIKQDN